MIIDEFFFILVLNMSPFNNFVESWRSLNECVKLCFNNRPPEVWNEMYVGKVVARRAGVILASECLVIS